MLLKMMYTLMFLSLEVRSCPLACTHLCCWTRKYSVFGFYLSFVFASFPLFSAHSLVFVAYLAGKLLGFGVILPVPVFPVYRSFNIVSGGNDMLRFHGIRL